MADINSVIVSNMALSLVGASSSISSLGEDSAEANACDLWYEWSRLQALEAFDWGFARRRKRLVLHPHPIPELGEWAYRYIYPTDCVKFRRMVNPLGDSANAVAYDIEEAEIDVVANGAFTSDDHWVEGTAWAIAAGVATGTTATSDLEQTILTELTEGETYSLVFTMTRSAGSIIPKVGGTSGTTRSTSGTFTQSIVAGTTDLLEFTGSGFTGTITDVSLSPATAGRAILTDIGDAVGAYTLDHSTLSRWSPLAIKALSFSLASNIAFELTGKVAVKDRMDEQFFAVIRMAATSNANEHIEKPPRDAEWIRER